MRLTTGLCCTLALTAYGLLALGLNGDEPSDASHETTRIELLVVGDLPDPLVERIVAHLDLSLSTQVRVLPKVEPQDGAKGLASQSTAVESLVGGNTFALVTLVTVDFLEKHPYIYLDPEKQIVAINAHGLRPAEKDGERYARRLEKQCIAGIAALAGVGPSPTADCATYRHTDDAGLDRKGRNLSPPQLKQFHEAARLRRMVGPKAKVLTESGSPVP